MRMPTVVRMTWLALKGWSKDDIPRWGASLAYYTLFSLAPMLIIAIGIAGLAFGEAAVRGELVGQIDGLLGPEGARAVEALLEGASRERAGLLAVIIGTATFLLASTGAFLELQHALNRIFRVKANSTGAVVELVKDRLRSFGMVLVIGFLLLVSLAVSAALSALSGWMEQSVAAIAALGQLVNIVVSVAVITVLFALIYRYLPDVRLKWSDVWVGGFITSVLFMIGKQLIGLYLGRSTVASSYGAAGSVAVLLLWVYYSSQILLLGAEITRIYAYRHEGEPPPTDLATRDPAARPSAPIPS